MNIEGGRVPDGGGLSLFLPFLAFCAVSQIKTPKAHNTGSPTPTPTPIAIFPVVVSSDDCRDVALDDDAEGETTDVPEALVGLEIEAIVVLVVDDG